jgi:hypothetical protein
MQQHNAIDFHKIFGARRNAGDELRAALHKYGRDRVAIRKDRDDDGGDDDRRRFDLDSLSDDDLGALADQIAERIGDDGDTDTKAGLNRHEVDKLADLVVEASGDQWQRPQALHWLMHTRNGAATLHRLRGGVAKRLTNKRKETKPMETYKVMDIPRIAKAIANDGRTSLTEAQLTEAITCYGKACFPDLRPDKAFAKVFSSDDEVGITFRKAIQIAKGMMPIIPVFVDADSVNDPVNALEELERLVERMRAAEPALSKAQAFAKVYAANPQLAAAERRQNRPRAVAG